MPSKKVQSALRKAEQEKAWKAFLVQLESHHSGGKWVAHQNGEILAATADFSELATVIGDRKVEVLFVPTADNSSELL